MAKVIRNRYVYRPHNRWHRYLPLRMDGIKEYNYEENNATPSAFPDPVTDPPSKLWLACLLFGENATPGEMHVFKNTHSINNELWRIKHLIELRPLTFPNGEPTEADINHTSVLPDGRCIIDRNLNVTADSIKIMDENKQFTSGQLSRKLQYRYAHFKDVYEDTVYNPKNISVVD
ncbi:hypothetical protein FO519_000572 [Halicephalobus sp. NKZ332]|nr:hypothetical protein FO519_000572 [Halicephalobus sp. NKZ332]